jgi:putative ABC transport system ATP-binding protein
VKESNVCALDNRTPFYDGSKRKKKINPNERYEGTMIRLQQVTKQFPSEAGTFTALKEVSIRIEKGEFIAIMGPSGSGKSTLLQLIGGLDLPSSGNIMVDGAEWNKLNEKERTLLRRTKVGFVFQNYQLLPMLTVEENVALSLAANKTPKSEIRARVQELLKDVNLEDKAKSFPSRLSGGQQQRAAVARALAMKPRLILADEPTGNLDRKNGEAVLDLLSRLNRHEQITVVMVTHDPMAAKKADRVIRIQDGEVVSEVKEGANQP